MSVIEAILHIRVDPHWTESFWRAGIVSLMRSLRLEILKQRISKTEMRFSCIAWQDWNGRGMSLTIYILFVSLELHVFS